MSSALHDQLPDAARLNWVDRYAPAALRPWLRLGRFDRPIGIWLLYLPCAMGLALGMAHPVFAVDALHPDQTQPQWSWRAAVATMSCAQGQAIIPSASTPTRRTVRSGVAAAIPISV